jgi:hypothetical protein
MTALSEFLRLESPGIWRESPDAQRREVIVAFGDATLVISDDRSARALAHWSLPAMVRTNPGKHPAIYAPGSEPGEELELEDTTMIAAIEKVHAAILARRPRPGRLRLLLGSGMLALVVGLGVLWLPGALITHAASVAPMSKRAEIGQKVLAELSALTGAPCDAPAGAAGLEALSKRLLGGGQIVVLPNALQGALRLPGQIVAVGRPLIEDHETPEVVAGYIIAADISAEASDPLRAVLEWVGYSASFRFLTTGKLPENALRGYGQKLLTVTPPLPQASALLARFSAAQVSALPYTQAVGAQGEALRDLLTSNGGTLIRERPLMPDGDWVALQGVCGL